MTKIDSKIPEGPVDVYKRQIVGRVAAIINHKANQTWNKKEVRFGWIAVSYTHLEL